MTIEQKLEALFNPAIESMGFDLWAIEYIPAGRHTTLRVFVDKTSGGINVDDCAAISRQLSAIMDVEDPIADQYMLEVSSPGLDRVLIKPEHFKRYQGKSVRVQSAVAILGRKKINGLMTKVTDDSIEVEVDGELFEIPFGLIDKANLAVVI